MVRGRVFGFGTGWLLLAIICLVASPAWARVAVHPDFRPDTDSHPDPAPKLSPTEQARVEYDRMISDPALRDLNIADWFSGESYDAVSIRYFRDLLKTSTPGLPPILALFLDRNLFSGPIREMVKAWGNREHAELPGTTTGLDAFFERYRGRTIFAISHVEGQKFILGSSSDSNHLEIDIPTAIKLATAHQVFLIPIGCKTALSGAPIGFRQNISTAKVVSFLKSSTSRVGNILASMQNIGPLQIDINATMHIVRAVVKHEAGNQPLSNLPIVEPPIIDLEITERNIPLSIRCCDNSFRLDAWVQVIFAATGISWIILSGLNLLSRQTWFLRRRERTIWLLLVQRAYKVFRFVGRAGLAVSAALVVFLLLTYASPWVILLVIVGAPLLWGIVREFKEVL